MKFNEPETPKAAERAAQILANVLIRHFSADKAETGEEKT